MTDYYFKEDHRIFRKGLSDFLQAEVVPNIDLWEEQQQIPKELWKEFGDMGYLGINYPEEYGGTEADFFYSVVFMEEIAKCHSGGFTIIPLVQQYMASPYIHKYGSVFLKDKYLRKAISGEWICAIAISEPGAGSDVANIQTRAEKKDGYYLVNGSKTFITNGYYGDFLVTVVKTNPEAGVNGVSLLVIDRNSDGLSASKLKKLGWHASDTAELHFDDVRVPEENLIGLEGQGFYYLMGGLQLERLAGAISSLSGAESTLSYALEYMEQREAFGRKINRFQVLRHRVAQMASEIEAIKQFVYYCCRLHDDEIYAVKECSMAKLLASELSDKVAYQSLQFFGGYGFMEEYKVARMFRDSRVGTIGGGTSEIMREIIAKMVIDDKQYSQASAEETKLDGKQSISLKQNGKMLETITSKIKIKADSSAPLGSTLKFSFKEGIVYLDGSGENNLVHNEDKEANCTVNVNMEDLHSLINGDLDPMTAFMSGKLQVQGDMGVAMKLQSILG